MRKIRELRNKQMFGPRANRHRALSQIGGLIRTSLGTRVEDTLARTKNLSGTGAQPYWCYNKTCKGAGISREGLEGHFVRLLAMMQPTAELIAKLPDIAESNWKQRSKRIEDEKRALQNRLNENESLNLLAIQARIKGELSVSDLEKFKESNNKSISDIKEQLRTLQSECFTMEQLMADARRSIVNLVQAWREADLARKQEIQTALFPDGLVFSPDSLFFEPRNHTLMQRVSELVDSLIKNGRGERI